MIPAETVLFLCSGNYYRSRLAEHYFNALAIGHCPGWRAESRGLKVDGGNIGPISYETLDWLAARGIHLTKPIRYPLAVTADDFQMAKRIVAVKEAEHRPLVERHFPAHIDRVEFWHVHDLDVATSAEALPEL